MTKDQKLQYFEKYVLEKAQKDRENHLDKQNKEIEVEISKKIHAMELENEKILNEEIEQIISEKNKQLQKEKNKLKGQALNLKMSQKKVVKKIAIKNLHIYTNLDEYVENLIKGLERETSDLAESDLTESNITEFVFCQKDQKYFDKIKTVTKDKKISFTGDFIGGYIVYQEPNIIKDNSFLAALEKL